MARKEDMTDYNDGIHKYTIFYVNETPVGKGSYHPKRTDVQLIQFFLRQFFKANSALAEKLPKTKSGISTMAIDGKYGNQTEAGIGNFQEWVKDQGKPVKIDNLVSVPHAIYGPVSGSVYTILHLNAWFDKFCDPDERGKIDHNLDLVMYAPELLREILNKSVTNKL